MDVSGSISPAGARPGRDTYLDFVRGAMILSVIHIHTVYWSLAPWIPDVVRHLAYLADIPVFFFLSGYLFRQTGFGAAVRSARRSFVRIYLHYAVITLLTAGVILLGLRLAGVQPDVRAGAVLGSVLRVEPAGRLWLYLKMFRGNLWYIQTYLPLLLLAPLLVGLPLFRRARWAVLALTVAGWALLAGLRPGWTFWLAPAAQVLFYAIFFVLGAVFRAEESRWTRRGLWAALGVNGLLAAGVFWADGFELILAPRKFPPTVQYLIYTMPLVLAVMLAKPVWRRMNTRRLAPLVWGGRHSLELYLIQGGVCSLPFFFAGRLGTDNPWALYAMVYSFNVLLTFGLAWLYAAGARRVRAVAARRAPAGSGRSG